MIESTDFQAAFTFFNAYFETEYQVKLLSLASDTTREGLHEVAEAAIDSFIMGSLSLLYGDWYSPLAEYFPEEKLEPGRKALMRRQVFWVEAYEKPELDYLLVGEGANPPIFVAYVGSENLSFKGRVWERYFAAKVEGELKIITWQSLDDRFDLKHWGDFWNQESPDEPTIIKLGPLSRRTKYEAPVWEKHLNFYSGLAEK